MTFMFVPFSCFKSPTGGWESFSFLNDPLEQMGINACIMAARARPQISW